MNLCMSINNLNHSNIFFSEPIKNTIIENSKFRK